MPTYKRSDILILVDKLESLMKIVKLFKILNIILSVVIAVAAIFILARPYLPDIAFALHTDQFQGYAFQSNAATTKLGEDANKLPPIPSENRLVIPKIFVNALITEGQDGDSAMNLGMWRRPNSNTPDQGGNTVIVGHRVLYTSGPSTFYCWRFDSGLLAR